MNPYLLDTNFFIQAHRSGYPLDVFPSFWNKIKTLANAGRILSIDKVKAEIYHHEDDLKIWCEANLPNSFFQNSTTVLGSYVPIVTWAHSRLNNPYSQQALNIFMDATEADAWLIAYAHANSFQLVTYEVSAPDSKKSIKIPDACQPFGVRSLLPIEMFREMGERI